jgi:hypothetical protein
MNTTHVSSGSEALFYHSSGKAPLAGVLAGLLAGISAGCIAAFLYAYAALYNPIIYINFLLVIGFGMAVGRVTSQTMAAFKVRNATTTSLTAIAAMCVAYYLAWCVWIHALLERSDIESGGLMSLLTSPVAVGEIIVRISEVGAWTLGRSSQPVHGIVLWLAWLVEAVMIFGFTYASTRSKLGTPFCEPCGRWCVIHPLTRTFSSDVEEQLTTQAVAHNFTSLKPLPVGTGVKWYELQLHLCPGCRQTNTLSILRVTMHYANKGKQREEVPVLSQLLVRPEEVPTLLESCLTDHTHEVAQPLSPPRMQ